eukprot:CAMPEP_0177702624 /NCGR_PEP_ID=MMETSP0484_2-20121128/7231_1 /TAXON_ID=354590 /ORGANISM="Rhodomonas lens, Strain RHODO" /LENGTH=380 /DNA_ID=CAMNT_0019213911 /DNA_START=241 /DNA_END=1380 /DNA_ORIENTATION=+
MYCVLTSPNSGDTSLGFEFPPGEKLPQSEMVVAMELAIRAAGVAAAVAVGRAAYVASYFRPVPDPSNWPPGHQNQDPSRYRTIDPLQEPISLQVARALTMTAGTAVAKLLMRGFNRIHVVDSDAFQDLLSAVRHREPRTPLITVANHVSCMDDPGLMGGLLPWDVTCNPNRMRWGLCTAEVCFSCKSPALAPLVHTLAGAGQALPITRGGGINQPLLLDAARQVSAGRWVHVFPEGRVIQGTSLATDPLTPRSEEEIKAKGRLKWGVGKLIAHSAEVPVIIPLYHTGMEHVLPNVNEWQTDQHGVVFYNNKVRCWWPGSGHTIHVRVGPRIEVRDLIEAHEALHGPLFKVNHSPARLPDAAQRWPLSSPSELQLYSDITR